jgi:hypothetical protein
MTETTLLTVKEAATHYNPRMKVCTFRCKILPVLEERHGLRIRLGKGRRVIWVIPAVLEALIEEERGLAG